MKPKTLLKTLVASAVPLILITLLVNSPTSGATIIVEAEPPAVPTDMVVLKAVSHEITREQALTIASKIFNVNGDAQYINGSWKITQDSKELWIYKSGNIKYYDNPKMEFVPYLPEELPSTNACISIAEQFPERLKQKSWSPKSYRYHFLMWQMTL